mmetsp:Transcript_23334/g.42313  ORF Transcript_23334/g.42313 Transcript_23334/m.42313 type:complete len:90 (-) Transcript_23334:96-365(-)
MSVANFKNMAQLAYIHAIENLKKACCKFLKTNYVAILKNPNVMSLPTKSPDLWAEFNSWYHPMSKKRLLTCMSDFYAMVSYVYNILIFL